MAAEIVERDFSLKGRRSVRVLIYHVTVCLKRGEYYHSIRGCCRTSIQSDLNVTNDSMGSEAVVTLQAFVVIRDEKTIAIQQKHSGASGEQFRCLRVADDKCARAANRKVCVVRRLCGDTFVGDVWFAESWQQGQLGCEFFR